MRCVILGGAGFLGRHVGRAMHEAGWSVWSVDRMGLGPNADWLEGEVIAAYHDVSTWWGAVGEVDTIIHLASSTVPASANADPVEDIHANLIGMLKLLEELRERNARPKLLFASSGGAVYGRPQSVPIAESHPTIPMGCYGVTKMAVEHHLRLEEATHGLPYRILRLSNPYGEWQRPQSQQGVIAVFAHRALMSQPLDVWGDGSVIRDFVHASDVGRAFVAASDHAGSSRIFNIGGGRGFSVNEIIETLEGIVGGVLERNVHPSRPFDPSVNVLDINRARNELGWEPVISFNAGVQKTFEWLRNYCLQQKI